ncbi:hypothetical protein RN629_16135 [Sphingomonadaceae bacterium jetA1]|jgi:hypothetical protein|uniref:hypothetical protein n=1 Tax=Facivitalis istanbulensis TaxID=3075838 RepID=UPI00346CC1F7
MLTLFILAAAAMPQTTSPPDPAVAMPSVQADPAEGTAPPDGALPPKPDPAKLPPLASAAATGPKLKLGGAIRARYDLRFNDVGGGGARRTSSHLSFDTLLLTADYDSSVIFGAAQYRFYGGSFIYGHASGYEVYPGEISFPMYAYVGAKLSAEDKVTVGLQPVPFDDRWWGSAFLNSLGFVYGLEEVYNLGVSASHQGKRAGFDIGFFPAAAPSAFGISRDSARFTVNLVRADSYVPGGTQTAERNMIVGRTRYQVPLSSTAKLTLTGSGWISTVHNFTTGRDGYRHAAAFSAKVEEGRWHGKLLAARQIIDPRGAGANDRVSVGDYDASYNIAARGTMLFGEVGRSVDTGRLPFELSLYGNYASFLKDGRGFPASERLTLGGFWTDKATHRIRIWSDLMIARNDPYIGAGQYLSGAAQGGDNRIKTSFLVLMGYYF